MAKKAKTKKAKAAGASSRPSPRESKAEREARLKREARNARDRERRAEARRAREEAERKAELARERRNERARERRAEAKLRREAAEREARLAGIVGPVRALVVNVFRGVAQPRAAFDPRALVAEIVGELARVTKGTPTDTGVLWSGEVRFARGRTHEALARQVARIPPIDTGGARVAFGALTKRGEFLPLSFAFVRTPEAVAMSVDELLKHLLTYGAALADEDEDEDEDANELGED